jgi:hypothetical protein
MEARSRVWLTIIVSLSGSLGCGGGAIGTRAAADDAGPGSSQSELDASGALDGSRAGADAGYDAGPGSSQSELDASGDASCDDLASVALAQLEPIREQNLACSEDTDCVWGVADTCEAPCGVLISQAGASAVQSAANRLCAPFAAQGCQVPELPCVRAGTTICTGGNCAAYDVTLTPYPLPAFTHGVCTALQLNYVLYDGVDGGPLEAPRDLAIQVRGSQGTVYSDEACTTPLVPPACDAGASGSCPWASLTIPSGSSSVAFGFVPTAAGHASIVIGPQDLTYGLTAQ